MNRCLTNLLSFLVRLTLFRHDCIVTWIISFIAAPQTVHTCRTAALHTTLSFLISLFASYDPQSQKILQFCCFQIVLSKKLGGWVRVSLFPPSPPPLGLPPLWNNVQGLIYQLVIFMWNIKIKVLDSSFHEMYFSRKYTFQESYNVNRTQDFSLKTCK